jgi:U4/U6 small nuclear ribonucleoprotein SNU13
MSDPNTRGKAWPIAPADLNNQVRMSPLLLNATLFQPYYVMSQILDLVQQASTYKQLKKGANEGMSCNFR